MEYLGKAKEALSATALSNREKKKQDICGLFKTVVRLADKRKFHDNYHLVCRNSTGFYKNVCNLR